MLGVAMTRPDIFGDALHEFMLQGTQHMGSMVCVCEDQPMHENRVELAAQKDQFGYPLARIMHETSVDGRKLWEIAAAEGVELLKAAGASEAWPGPQGGQHIMGGTIMGTDPSNSVLNSVGQAHEVSNLFVGGPGVFPTGSAANSTFTAKAVAMKSAKFMVDNWNSL
jgi:choline dehydrogenase-like flavoprotein